MENNCIHKCSCCGERRPVMSSEAELLAGASKLLATVIMQVWSPPATEAEVEQQVSGTQLLITFSKHFPRSHSDRSGILLAYERGGKGMRVL